MYNKEKLGNVEYVTHMGSDLTVVNSARVSLNKKVDKIKYDDIKLINYLAKHGHWTPFSHCQVQFRLKMPIFVSRQWFKSSVGFCLSGDTFVHFLNNKKYKIRDLYNFWQNKVLNQKFKQTPVVCLMEYSKELRDGYIKNVFYSGKKQIYEIELENGNKIKTSRDHLFFTTNGWQTLHDAIDLYWDGTTLKHNFDICEFYTSDIEEEKIVFIDYSKGSDDNSTYHWIAKKSKHYKAIKVTPLEEEDVFDLEIDYIYPNFIANGFVVHNSRNEVSRRYVDDPPTFFHPDGWRERPTEGIKQGSRDSLVKDSESYKSKYKDLINHADWLYKEMINDGIAPEMARMCLPQSMHTEFIETGSLFAYARIFKLRQDSHAQREIQWFANEINTQMETLFPHSWNALRSYYK